MSLRNALKALVSSEQVRFKQPSETDRTDGRVPDEIRERGYIQRYTDKFKSLGIDKCPYKIPRTERTYDPVNLQDGVDSMIIELLANDVITWKESYLKMTS